MRRKTRMLLFAPLAALLVLAAIAGRVEVGDAAPQVAPRNEAPPTITGTPQEGQALTAATGRWSGTEPITYAFAWRRCDENGGSCSAIGGANERTYTLRKVDVGNTLRVRVTARNADGDAAATSVPTAVVRAAPAPPPTTGCDGNPPLQVANINLPDRLLVDGQGISPAVVGRSTQTITIRAHVSCKAKAVQGALRLRHGGSLQPVHGRREHDRRRRLGQRQHDPAERLPGGEQPAAADRVHPCPEGPRDRARRHLDPPARLLPGRPAPLARSRHPWGDLRIPPRPSRARAKIAAMAHLRLIEVREASGPLREEYDAAVARAGKVFNIVKAMSLSPAVLHRSMELYKGIMHGPSALSRQERELLAVVVSRVNDCHY